jgi:hypothetical protein
VAIRFGDIMAKVLSQVPARNRSDPRQTTQEPDLVSCLKIPRQQGVRLLPNEIDSSGLAFVAKNSRRAAALFNYRSDTLSVASGNLIIHSAIQQPQPIFPAGVAFVAPPVFFVVSKRKRSRGTFPLGRKAFVRSQARARY